MIPQSITGFPKKNLLSLPEVIPDSPSETTFHNVTDILLKYMRAVQPLYSSMNIEKKDFETFCDYTGRQNIVCVSLIPFMILILS